MQRWCLTGPAGFDLALHLLGGAGKRAADHRPGRLLSVPAAAERTGGCLLDRRYSAARSLYAGAVQPHSSVRRAAECRRAAGPCARAGIRLSSGRERSESGCSEVARATSAQLSAGAGTTQYFFSFTLTPGTSANVLNNNVPVDPILGGALVVTKTTPLVNVTRGDLVPYTISVTNTLERVSDERRRARSAAAGLCLPQWLRLGERHRARAAAIGTPAHRWTDQSFAPHERKVYRLVLVVGSGVGEGEYVESGLRPEQSASAPRSRTSQRRRFASCPTRCSTAPM